MVTHEKLKELYKDDADFIFNYLKHKNTGGKNNARGNCFENHYSIYQIAKKYNEHGNKVDTTFSSQLLCFVDDLIITSEEKKKAEHFQIKDVGSLAWTTANNSIARDFELQHQVTTAEGKEVNLTLVVSRQEIYDKLSKELPNEIKDVVSLALFSPAPSIQALIKVNEQIREQLVNICAISNPQTDKLEAIAGIILGVWDGSDKNEVSMQHMAKQWYNQNPSYIKGFEGIISEELETIFNAIEGFVYSVQNGYILWKYRQSDNGTISFPIGSTEYVWWENETRNLEPKTFEELESQLI